jgi:recombination protein RecA
MGDGISKEGGLLDVGLELNVLTKSGAFLKFGTQMLGQGREAAKLFLRENHKIAKEISDNIWKAVKTGTPQPKVVGSEEVE